jgi:hypothetical protein
MALERYHLAHQDYPQTLDDLIPDNTSALPLDLVTQASFKYERQSKDAYRLWSVGWNQKDDNGQVVKKTSDTLNLDEGDWTWPQPVKDKE